MSDLYTIRTAELVAVRTHAPLIEVYSLRARDSVGVVNSGKVIASPSATVVAVEDMHPEKIIALSSAAIK